ncbi:MAG: hypothetical protein AB1756_02845 [Acidobacteriota bacterium]
MRIRFVLLIILVLALPSIPVFAKDITVGDFALKLANAINVKVSSASGALRILQERGLFDANLKADSMMTEKVLADIFIHAGIKAETVNPVRNIDEGFADTVISTLTGTLAMNAPTTPAPQNPKNDDDEANNNGNKTRPKGQEPNSRANPNAFSGREDD